MPDINVDADIPNLGDLRTRIDNLLNNSDDLSDEERLTALSALETELNGYAEQLQEAADQLTAAETQLEEADATLAEMQSKLEAAEESYNQLSAELDEKLAAIDGLNEQIAALNTQSETDAEALAALQTELDAATADAESLSGQLDAQRAEYEKQLAAVEAYKLSRELTDGDAHTATSVRNVIDVAEDGVTAAWHYDNTAISRNPVVLSLQLDGETIFASEALNPGETLEEITLDKPLEPGTYQAVAVTSIYDADGELQFANRVPVTLNVAG